MCALAHYFEEAGIATATIVLVREHAERMRPPRALWVPFELGRPIASPNDAPFQRRVLTAALERLLVADRPGTIVDFPEEDPRRRPDGLWAPPVMVETDHLRGSSHAALAKCFLAEVVRLKPYHEQVLAQSGRTTVGLVGCPVPALADYVASFLTGDAPTGLVGNMSAALALRFAADDLKAYYLESALATGGRPSSRQLVNWFWDSTWGGAALLAARAMALASNDDRLRRIGERFLVPRARVPSGERAD